MKKNRNVSLAKIGMNKDVATDSLQNQSYTFALNMNIEDESGNILKLKSEHSNILGSKFKQGFKVIGFETDINTGFTYFFLTNPDTKVSEIGVIKNNSNIDMMSDVEVECSSCNHKRILSEPLEDTTQQEYLEYTTLLEDSCNLCLNFNVSYPIKKVIIKNEKSSIKIFFSDNFNPPRYIDLSRLEEYSYTGVEVCGEDNTEATCIACDKLRMFPIYNPVRLRPQEQVIGGNLGLGQYSFYVSYSNKLGDELSEYSSLTNPVSIFDENNRIIPDEEKRRKTNYAIKLEVEDLDSNFEYFKVAVSYSNVLDGGTRHYELGVFPTTTKNVLFTTLLDKREISLNELLIPNANIKLIEGLATSNNYLFGYGLTREKEWNLQPVINLLGGFVKWQTHIGKEDLYKDGINNSLYKGYMRDEVYPLAISFTTNYGYVTPRFPLIARPATSQDREEVGNLDSESIAAGINICNSNLRNEKWQFYNTATVEGVCSNVVNAGNFEIGVKYEILEVGDTDFTSIGASANEVGVVFTATGVGTGTGTASLAIPTNTVIEPVTKICKIDNVVSHGPSSFIINNPSQYTTLEDFLNETLATGECDGYPFCGIIDPTLYSDCAPEFENCNTPILDIEFMQVNNIVNESVETFYIEFPSEYSKLKLGGICYPHTRDGSGNFIEDEEFVRNYVTTDFGNRSEFMRVFEREESNYNTSPSYADILNRVTDPTQDLTQSYHHIFQVFDTVVDAQQSNFITTDVDTYSFSISDNAGPPTIITYDNEFTNRLHKNALWYKITSEELTEDFILEVTKLVQDEISYALVTKSGKVRVNIFNSSSSGTSVYSKIVNLNTEGLQILAEIDENADEIVFKESDVDPGVVLTGIPNNLYIAIDLPLVESEGDEPGFFTLPTKGCFGVTLRNKEVAYLEASYDLIEFDKVQKYTAPCRFDVPVVPDCGVVPYKKGEFAYWESVETYPDNDELYNSKVLQVAPEDFYNEELAAEFQTKYTEGIDLEGNFELNDDTDFTCKAIRHFKFPDNAVSPFMYENEQAGFVQSVIYPMGVTIDEKLINNFLDIAVKNNLITQEQRDSIVGYEIFRGDRTLNKSIVAKGLAYDMYKYTESNKEVLFPNFPYNSLGNNNLILNDSRTAAIPHPFGSNSNYNFTFHSPDTEFRNPTLPTEVKIEGYAFGKSKGVFDEVEEHPKYVILGKQARNLASTLAVAEVVAEALVASMQALANYDQVAGFTNTVFSGAWVASPTIATAIGIAGALFKYGRYKYEWLNTFRDLGSPENFAYYYTSVGEYNYLKPLQTEGNTLRSIMKANYLKAGRFTVVNEVEGDKLELNNVDREQSVFITLGENFPITYPDLYKDYDNASTNSNLSSRFIESNTFDCSKGRSKEFSKNIASPYVSLKNYLPSQYGGIDNITWLTTSYYGDLTNPRSSCLEIFGGDTFISRHTLKRKVPLFLTSAMGLANRTPFNYRSYSNLGQQPRFYANFLSPDEVEIDRGLPDIKTEYEFDCLSGDSSFYVKSPSKFYLYYYGIPSFLTETTINTNYRTGRPARKDAFYPLVGDYVDWTQESKLSIKEDNTYYYDSVFSSNTRVSIGRTLPATYSKEKYDTLFDEPNGMIFSLPDNNENDLTEPWLIFKPLDKYEFPTSYGKLIELRGIESQAILARFNHTSSILNTVDSIVDDGSTPETQNLGTGLRRRPVTFSATDLGYEGTQSSNMVSNEYGHFWVDAKRGQVFQLPNSQSRPKEISSFSGDAPSGMRNWFKQHLPFKVLNNLIQNYEDIDVDNPYNSIGITMGWDSRYKRVFITKKDYKPKKPMLWACKGFYINELSTYTDVINDYESNGFEFVGIEDCRLKFKTNKEEDVEFAYEDLIKVELNNTEYFEDTSWTIAFSITSNSWVSFYDFKPNYYISHNNYFQTGLNNSLESEFGLWSHLLTNKSFGVFYGKKYEVGFEYPTINNFASKTLESIELWTEALRYHSEYDFAYNRDVNFNKLVISNHRESTGELRLVPQKTLRDNIKFPKTYKTYQEILMTNSQDRWKINYLYNRVNSEYLNQPIWEWDVNQIKKTLNKSIVKFKGKRVLERLRGDFFLNYLGYDKDSRYQVSFKWAIADENLR